jgi:hypothetical protein
MLQNAQDMSVTCSIHLKYVIHLWTLDDFPLLVVGLRNEVCVEPRLNIALDMNGMNWP